MIRTVCFSGNVRGAIAAAIRDRLVQTGAYQIIADTIPQHPAADIAICTYGKMIIKDAEALTWEPVALTEANYLQPRRFVEKHAIAMHRDQIAGLIVVLGSNAGRYGNVGAEDYAAQKAALAKYLELRARRLRTHGIRVCHLALGAVATAFWDKACQDAHPSLTRGIKPDLDKALTVDEVAATVQMILELPPRVTIGDALVTSVDYQ